MCTTYWIFLNFKILKDVYLSLNKNNIVYIFATWYKLIFSQLYICVSITSLCLNTNTVYILYQLYFTFYIIILSGNNNTNYFRNLSRNQCCQNSCDCYQLLYYTFTNLPFAIANSSCSVVSVSSQLLSLLLSTTDSTSSLPSVDNHFQLICIFLYVSHKVYISCIASAIQEIFWFLPSSTSS